MNATAKSTVGVGTVLAGRYRLTELIGEGGMSRVYKALDQQHTTGGAPAVIVVKVLTQRFTNPAGSFAALSSQVRRWRRLVHPNIVRLLDCERDDRIAFITMEYLPGESAYAKLHRRPVGSPVPLDAAEARFIVGTVANALEYAHGQDVVHGDLKPGNIMLTGGFGLKVIDFGTTRWRTRPGMPANGVGAGAATAHYASPQLIAGDEPSPADDVFSLACVAYELLTGVHPFDGEAAARTFEEPPPQRPGMTPSEYAAIVHALQPDRDRRPATVREFMAEFAPRPHSFLKSRWPGYVAAAAAVIIGIYFWPERKSPVLPPPTVKPTQPVAAPLSLRSEVKAGAVIQDCPTCPPMTILPSGSFEQGAAETDFDALPSERPQHTVHVNYLLAMSSSDITVDDFRQFVEATSRSLKGCDIYEADWRHRSSASWKDPGFAQAARHPVVCVSWHDAVAYADWLSVKTGHRYRLPSASEWEYAARAGGATSRPWGSDPAGACVDADIADRSAEQRYPGWSVFPCDDGYIYTAPIGSFKSNGFGLSDILGNVLVWTEDCWQPDYQGAPNDGSAREAPNCGEHEVRGGSWFSTPPVVKASYRNHFGADYRTSSLGIRLVREMG